jgi:cyclophilin family peptidyl-prolyl cis-trans isomerase
VYAARAARRLADTLALRRLARDADANVASEAIDGLSATVGHADDTTYVAALGSNASQLLMSAAKALAGSGATAPLVAALDRMTARRRDTERDARMALVEALGAAVPARYARDFDPVVAGRVAELAGVPAAPQPVPGPPPPTAAQLRGIHAATIEMADGGRIELRLFPFDAPTNSWRFARLARAGYYDGLTFHRVAPFFVVQGGSPLANEYVGDGPYTRDEVGLENRRGTVGVSTRGRDTGDGQIYFNTVDNVRLDHDYTVFAEVVSGMEVVDRMQEGARIRRVRVR